ncbi:relaxase/mobilization nuclease domain-containing protein [Chitinophaga sp. CC14]|uniref:relaxase/mobilization nuclease domain-containing protein n=1 Tax=Chitinophaga sp. CC14 TaxID=3029199 RepID=UPI003B7D3A7F
MYAEIGKPTANIGKMLNYNEQKVKAGTAALLHAGNFLQEKEHLSFYDKMKRFTDLNELNTVTTKNAVHIILNFHPSDKLNDDLMKTIGTDYMNRIGMGNQPYLLYRHSDTALPHIHIVTNLINETGRRIPTHNIGRDKSDPARKNIEADYGLARAADHPEEQQRFLPVLNLGNVIYGKSETKRRISNVLANVVNTYKYGSLPELNAILQLSNVYADPCKDNSRVFRNKGLYYRALDVNGKKAGVPIKASSIYLKPTLGYLENKFLENASLKKPEDEMRIKALIDWHFHQHDGGSLSDLFRSLEKQGVSSVRRINEHGRLYGVTFVDHIKKTVYNGSSLGKGYSAAALSKKANEPQNTIRTSQRQETSLLPANPVRIDSPDLQKAQLSDDNMLTLPTASGKMIEQLIGPENSFQGPEPNKKKKRRKRPSID